MRGNQFTKEEIIAVLKNHEAGASPAREWQAPAMRSIIDSVGRVVIPKTLRERVELGRGRGIEISERDGKIEIEPLSTPMSLVGRRGRPVGVPQGRLPVLTDEVVRATIGRRHR